MAKSRMFLVILALAGLISTCKTPGPEPAPGTRPIQPRGPCFGGKAHPDRPIVCVDDSSEILRVTPDPVVFHDTLSTDKSMSPGILWFTRSGRGDLQIRFHDEGCVRNLNCHGSKCSGAAARLDVLESRRCKYDVILTGHPTLDPEAVITRCCITVDGD